MLFMFLLAFTLRVNSQDFSNYHQRKQWILESVKDATLTERGKHGLPKAIARLGFDPKDESALTYITNILDHKDQSMFDFPGLALALCRYWDSFNGEQLVKIKSDLEALAIGGEKGFLGHGTENHATMRWCSAYLFAQLFPEAEWANGMSSTELMAEMKERLRLTFKNVYERGYTEYLSTTYEVVMNFPVEILLEYSHDLEMKKIAEAFMIYKWSILSLNNFEGNMLAPYGRMNTQQDHSPDSDYIAATTFYSWLMWGWGKATNNVKSSDFLEYNEATYSVYAALSGIEPEDVFFQMALLKEPFELKSSASTFGAYGSGVPHLMMRKIYRDETFAIGTGNFNWVPGGDYADHDANGFSIVWQSADRFNYIGCYHPFWYSDGHHKDRTPDTWYKGNISPFQQTGHHKNTVVTLFDIPKIDPWPYLPNKEKWQWRDQHANNLLARGMLRYPKSIDEQVEDSGWIFLCEGETFVGIKPLKPYYIQTNLQGTGLDGFHIVKSDYAQTGFVIELGSKGEFKSFDQFKYKLKRNKLFIDWETMNVTYTDTQKDKIQVQFQSGLPVATAKNLPEHLEKKGITGLAQSFPKILINGFPDTPFSDWPMISSPYVNMDNSTLKISYDDRIIEVNWQEKHPKIRKATTKKF